MGLIHAQLCPNFQALFREIQTGFLLRTVFYVVRCDISIYHDAWALPNR